MMEAVKNPTMVGRGKPMQHLRGRHPPPATAEGHQAVASNTTKKPRMGHGGGVHRALRLAHDVWQARRWAVAARMR